MHARFMKTFRMNYEKSSSSSDDDNDFDRQGYKKCSGCTGWDHQLICCSACRRCYHNNCHIPPLPTTMAYTDLMSYKSWTCTMCIDIDHISKVMRERTSIPTESRLDNNEMIMASRILLELICDEKNSFQFIELPFKYSDPHYYKAISAPISLNSVKKRLLSKNNYYKSFSEVLFNIKKIYSNNLFYYSRDDPYHAMAQRQDYLLFQMLNKWVPQYRYCLSFTALPSIKSAKKNDME